MGPGNDERFGNNRNVEQSTIKSDSGKSDPHAVTSRPVQTFDHFPVLYDVSRGLLARTGNS